jgi:VIT1/CCC1 family predicted Fe2+/Mn2+ transporter
VSAAEETAAGGASGPQAEIHHEHRDVTGGWLRPAVFGAMDGLVSNFALIAGIAGGQANKQVVVLAGLAGLAAGAFSMAAGEFISVASQSEMTEAEIAVERYELQHNAKAEQYELAKLYETRGLDPQLAAEVARQLSKDPKEALEIHAREELGVDPDNLPSPVVAAASSFLCFAVGAFIPVLPYLLGATNLWPAGILAGIGLFAAGALVSRVTARSWWFSGLRQLLLGGAAAAVTFGVGAAIGTTGIA